MRLTLAFDVYNKEQWLDSLLRSWLDNLSGKHDYEVIVVFDGCHDKSEEVARKVIDGRGLDYLFLHAANEYEIFCNDLALRSSTGDLIVFIQDDNWMFDQNWDDTLVQVHGAVARVGAIGLLAGLELQPDSYLRYRRVEVARLHKELTAVAGLESALGIWAVDAICRPFAISTRLLREVGGLDFAFRPTCGDDLDLSLNLLRRGYGNLYIPFDVKNSSGSVTTMSDEFRQRAYERAYELCWARHGYFIADGFSTSLGYLQPLKTEGGALTLVGPAWMLGYSQRTHQVRRRIRGQLRAFLAGCRTFARKGRRMAASKL